MKITIVSIILSFLSFPLFAQKTDYKKPGAPIPMFVLQKSNGGYLIPSHLKKNKPVMIMIFSPQCEHCGTVIDSLKNIRTAIKETQMIFVAEERNKEFMQGFIAHEGIGADALFKNIGVNKGELIAALYTHKILPQLIFYDEHHQLVKILDGQYGFEEVRKYLK